MTECKKRNFGIDCLRALSMIFIVLIHFFNHGGILLSIKPGTIQYMMSYLLFSVVICGVDIFAVISGFVGYDAVPKKYRWAKFVELWLTVVFYGCLLFFGMCYLIPNYREKMFLEAITPLASNGYWYFRSYFIVFIIAPFINIFVRKASSDKICVSLVAMLAFLYFSHAMTGFFSPTLLVFLYFVGAVMKKYNIVNRLTDKKCQIILISLILTTWLWKIIITPIIGDTLGNVLLRYDSPTIMGMAVFWVILFASKKFSGTAQKVITFVTPSVFSVYLINDNNLVREYLINDSMNMNGKPFWMLIIVIFISIIFFVAAVLIDKIRVWIFAKLNITAFSIKAVQLFSELSIKGVLKIKQYLFER